MLKKQLLLIVTILGLAAGIYIVLQVLNWDNSYTDSENAISPNDLLIKSLSSERLIGVDELTTIIISEDPSFLLVDLRDKEQFSKFTLPKAINLAPADILKEENQSIFKTDAYTVVLFSNGIEKASKAWILLRRAGYRNIMVLDGGMNTFYTHILNPEKPKEVDAEEMHDLYRFRKAAAVYFGMPNPSEFIPKQEESNTANQKSKTKIKKDSPRKKSVKIARKNTTKIEEEEEEDEGC